MRRDTIVFTVCGFLLGLTIGSLAIGPKLAQSKLAGAPAVNVGDAAATPAAAPPAGANPMGMVKQRIASLKDAIAKDPNNADALVQLGGMYMDAAKFPQAAEYLERALAIRDDANVRTDLGICYKQAGRLDDALGQFQHAAALAPSEWQPLFNEAIVLVDMKRMDEARTIAAKLQQMQPSSAEVQQLVASLKAP
jgi:tetratricopeptide (TPR) repeat protein